MHINQYTVVVGGGGEKWCDLEIKEERTSIKMSGRFSSSLAQELWPVWCCFLQDDSLTN